MKQWSKFLFFLDVIDLQPPFSINFKIVYVWVLDRHVITFVGQSWA